MRFKEPTLKLGVKRANHFMLPIVKYNSSLI